MAEEKICRTCGCNVELYHRLVEQNDALAEGLTTLAALIHDYNKARLRAVQLMIEHGGKEDAGDEKETKEA